MITVAVVGTAGRKDDASILTLEHWEKMCLDFKKSLMEINPSYSSHMLRVISGGAAWADHLAVETYLDDATDYLTICAPCQWDGELSQYYDSGIRGWVNNPGGTANYYHKLFSQKCAFDSLDQIDALVRDHQHGEHVEFVVGEGFHARNSLIAQQCQYLFAYTTREGEEPRDGGTLDTWNKCPSHVKKFHRPILSL